MSKEDRMLRLLLALSPAHVMHQLGTGRALENATREHEEVARTMAIIDELAGRLEPQPQAKPQPKPTPKPVPTPAATGVAAERAAA
jgi:hypothetical protein